MGPFCRNIIETRLWFKSESRIKVVVAVVVVAVVDGVVVAVVVVFVVVFGAAATAKISLSISAYIFYIFFYFRDKKAFLFLLKQRKCSFGFESNLVEHHFVEKLGFGATDKKREKGKSSGHMEILKRGLAKSRESQKLFFKMIFFLFPKCRKGLFFHSSISGRRRK